MIEDYFADGKPWGVKIKYIREEIPMGTAGALLGIFVFPGFSATIPGASQLKDMIAFVVLIGVLMVRPAGLLGERLAVEERA